MQDQSTLEAALSRRDELLASSQTDCCRLVHGAADGFPGLVLDRFGPVLIAQLHEGVWAHSDTLAQGLCERAASRVGASAVYRKRFPRDRSFGGSTLDAEHRDPQPWVGSPCEPEITVRENRMRFRIRPYDGYSAGLYCEQRDNRLRIRRCAAGRRVLNLFSYTCGFSIAAAGGGAAGTVNVDLSKRFLDWGQRNFAANEIDLSRQRFFARDVLDWFRAAQRQQQQFDLIVIDPPTFARGRKSVLALPQDWPRILKPALDRLALAGLILLCTNHRETHAEDLRRILQSAASPRRVRVIEQPSPPSDFHGDPQFSSSIWAAL